MSRSIGEERLTAPHTEQGVEEMSGEKSRAQGAPYAVPATTGCTQNEMTPATNLTTPLDLERLAYQDFARNHAVPEYRGFLDHLYGEWHECNDHFFDGSLRAPHIGIGRTHPRRFSECRLTTDHGGTIAITLSERIAFGIDSRIVRRPWPAAGLIRLLDDLLVAETVKQSVLELRGSTEDGYGGYGQLFAAEATRIGPLIGLPEGEVLARRRGYRGRGAPVAASWPWAFREPGYYHGDIDLSRVKVAGLGTTPLARQPSPLHGVYDYLLHLASTNQIVRLIDVLGRQVDAEAVARSPAVAAFERSPHDASGMPLPAPVIDPAWLHWNGVLTRRLFDGMPILADALQDAGCEDPVLLGHCRAHATHTADCWALRLLLTEPT
jgi:hypothetical protein